MLELVIWVEIWVEDAHALLALIEAWWEYEGADLWRHIEEACRGGASGGPRLARGLAARTDGPAAERPSPGDWLHYPRQTCAGSFEGSAIGCHSPEAGASRSR